MCCGAAARRASKATAAPLERAGIVATASEREQPSSDCVGSAATRTLESVENGAEAGSSPEKRFASSLFLVMGRTSRPGKHPAAAAAASAAAESASLSAALRPTASSSSSSPSSCTSSEDPSDFVGLAFASAAAAPPREGAEASPAAAAETAQRHEGAPTRFHSVASSPPSPPSSSWPKQTWASLATRPSLSKSSPSLSTGAASATPSAALPARTSDARWPTVPPPSSGEEAPSRASPKLGSSSSKASHL
mmetsp:Transcript_100865/g.266651  ORF Transcript_100865/g.266651 Transcript_100865/m.266651 type:complete len:250 (+) Transcript_100865:166-915(+)